jgi:SAM-dependent methyltransferase
VLFQRKADFTVTSAQVPTSIETIDVRVCPVCSHVQSREIDDLSRYYDSDYNFHVGDDQKDDLYSIEDGKPIYRAEHQYANLVASQAFDRPMRVLDYGCGKAPTLRSLSENFATVEPLVFDVSAAYKPFWDEFVPAAQQAVHDIPDDWTDSCDLITSFFALEHVAEPRRFAADVLRLLRPGGRVHLLVPNMYENINDILVVDHINHFSPASLHRLFQDAGFEKIAIDPVAHKASLTLTAERPERGRALRDGRLPETGPHISAAHAIAADCTAMFEKIEALAEQVGKAPVAIFGSGIYAMMILASFSNHAQVLGFLDNNKFRQGGQLFGIPILAPNDIPAGAEYLVVGLNPKFARQIIASVPALDRPKLKILYL